MIYHSLLEITLLFDLKGPSERLPETITADRISKVEGGSDPCIEIPEILRAGFLVAIVDLFYIYIC